jgi:hypothetical protein
MRLTIRLNEPAILKTSDPNRLTKVAPEAEVSSRFSDISLNMALGLYCSQAEYAFVSPTLLPVIGLHDHKSKATFVVRRLK